MKQWWIKNGQPRGAIVVATVLVVYLVSQMLVGFTVEAGDAADSHLVVGFQYQGNVSCTGSKCHSADEPVELNGQEIGDESNIWAEADPHNQAYETLASDRSKEMADKLNLPNATEAAQCLDCHAINAPAKQQGEGFALSDAVGCEACHGPAEKYLNLHAQAGWTDEQRNTIGLDGLRKTFGLLDTTNLAVRAKSCVNCHLQIDKDMIDVGHPSLEFELYAYNYYVSKKYETEFSPHWEEPRGQLIDAKLWTTGQAAALAAAQQQMRVWQAEKWNTTDALALVDMYQAALEVVQKHFGATTMDTLAKVQYTSAQCTAAAIDLGKHADKIQGQVPQRFLIYGITALVSAAYDSQDKDVPEAFWDAYDTALEAHSSDNPDNYRQAVKQMMNVALSGP